MFMAIFARSKERVLELLLFQFLQFAPAPQKGFDISVALAVFHAALHIAPYARDTG